MAALTKKIIFSGLAVLALTVVGCDRSNNEPDPEPNPINPDEVVPVYPVAREGWDIYIAMGRLLLSMMTSLSISGLRRRAIITART